MWQDVHSRGIHVAKPWHIFFCLPIDEIECCREKLLVHCLHAFLWKWSRIFDCLFANSSKLWVRGRIIFVGCFALQHTAWTKLLTKVWILRIVSVIGFFLSIQVIKVAEEFIKAVNSR